METMEDRVERGAALFDEAYPEWPLWIDIDRLAMQLNRHCLLGQLYGTFEQGLTVLGIIEPDDGVAQGAGSEFGLNLTREEAETALSGEDLSGWSNAWDRLRIAWVGEIEARRAS